MALTSHIRASEANFKLAQKLVESLSGKFGFSQEDGWNYVCSMPVEACIRRFRKEKRKRDPTKCVKKPRTAFSFFTQEQRKAIQDKNPTAKFGELSRLVSGAWKSLSEAQLKVYKEKEAADRQRYNTELVACRERLAAEAGAAAPAAAPATPVEAAPAKKSAKKEKKVEAAPAAVAAPVAAAPAAASTPAKKEKKVEAASAAAPAKKEKKVEAAPAAAPAATPAAAAAPKKEKKSAKAAGASA